MVLINGILGDQLPVTDRGLLYGDGVWETLGVKQGIPQLLDWHLERLQQGLQALGIAEPDWQALRQSIAACCAGRERQVLKLTVTRGSGPRGYNPQSCGQPTQIVQLSGWAQYPADYAEHGIRLALCETRLAPQPRLAGFKHLNRLEQVLARAEFGDEYQEGLVRDYAGQVVEGTFGNLFVVQENGEVCTPDLTQCGIAGVMRRFIIQLLGEQGIACHIRPLSLEAVRQARALFMTNSLIGVWAVREFAGKTYGIPPLIRNLQEITKAFT